MSRATRRWAPARASSRSPSSPRPISSACSPSLNPQRHLQRRITPVDLHAHTTASDGSASPEALLAHAATIGLTAVAVTDHDTVSAVAAATAAGALNGVAVVAGVELSAVDDRGAEVHILGLHLDDVSRIAAPLARFQADRITRAEAIVAALNRGGVPVTIEAVMAVAGPGAVGRPHVARALVAGGWARDLRDAFDRWLGADRPAFVEKPRLEIADAIRIIHDAGGVAIWAHPGREGTRQKIEAMVARGLDGVEVSHPGHSMDDMNRLNALARHRDLLRSGGSDWHGATDGPRVLGVMRVPDDWNDEQAARATRYRSADVWRSPAASRS